MARILIQDLSKYIDQEVTVKGWVQKIRDQKTMQFIIIRDHTGMVQVTLEKSITPELGEIISTLGVESAVSITGKVIENPKVRLNGLEIQITALTVDNAAHSPLPFDLFSKALPGIDTRLNWRYLDLRKPENLLIFQIQTHLEMAMREFFVKEGCIEMHSPKFMGSPSESGAELFSVKYFEETAYLAQSPQFYKQMAMSAGFDKVFEIGPVFRADPSFTSRHNTEFTSIDVELSWIDSHDDVMSFQERLLQYAIERIKELYGSKVKETYGTDIIVPEVPFPRITMKEALKALAKKGYAPPPDKKGDLDPEGERLLAEYVKNRFKHEFCFLTDYPIEVRPFYHMVYNEEPETTKSYDLLWKGLEITTGAQREHRYDVLTKQALEKGLTLEPIQFYLDFFKYGCPPHGGFGLGLARTVMMLTGINNIREVTYIHRGPNRLHP